MLRLTYQIARIDEYEVVVKRSPTSDLWSEQCCHSWRNRQPHTRALHRVDRDARHSTWQLTPRSHSPCPICNLVFASAPDWIVQHSSPIQSSTHCTGYSASSLMALIWRALCVTGKWHCPQWHGTRRLWHLPSLGWRFVSPERIASLNTVVIFVNLLKRQRVYGNKEVMWNQAVIDMTR